MTEEQFAEYLALAYERSGVEFKGPGLRTDPRLFAKVVRAALSMANRRDGGLVIIGVDDDQGTPDPVGLTQEQLASWQAYDQIADALSRYADPVVSFDLETHQQDGKQFIVLVIHEFAEVPVLCKKSYHDGPKELLREGACYVRSRHKPETAEIPSQAEMRELLELATEKRLRRFLAQVRAVGLPLAETTPTDEQLFAQEYAGWSSPLLEKIASRGYWRVIIHPARYERERIAMLPTLYSVLERASVQIRGWDFPHLEHQQRTHFASHWIGYESQVQHFLETWRFYQSGQLVDVTGLVEDWLDESRWIPHQPGWKPGTVISVEEILYRMTEVFELAARLAAIEGYQADQQLTIAVYLEHMRDRVLYLANPRKVPLLHPYRADIDEISYQTSVARDELLARPRELAVFAAIPVFHRFHWEPSDAGLRNIQAEIGK